MSPAVSLHSSVNKYQGKHFVISVMITHFKEIFSMGGGEELMVLRSDIKALF